MKKLLCVISAAFFAAGVLAGCKASAKPAASADPAPSLIEVGGSTSVTPLMELFAAEYQKQNPKVKVNINPTGSGDGIKNTGALYDIGMSSRELTPAEQGAGFREYIVAIDGIALIVNSANPVGSLTVEEIRDIFTGTVTDWIQVSGGAKNGKIAVVSREEGSGTRGAFEEIVGFQGKLVKGANEFTSTGAIKAGVAGNPDAIGYISLGSVDNSVKALSVNGAAPTKDNVLNNAYKIARPFIALSKSDASPASKAFLEWMLSPAGQDIAGTSWIKVK